MGHRLISVAAINRKITWDYSRIRILFCVEEIGSVMAAGNKCKLDR